MSVIELKDVSVTFHEGGRTVEAVKHVTLNVDKGEIFGIVGFSGAGKSTLVRTINLLERPTGGQVVIDGNDVTGLRGADLRGLRKKIGFIFQGFNLIGNVTVGKNIEFALKAGGYPKPQWQERIRELLTLVGLENKIDSYPSSLSGGQKQRVSIARALANEPEILLCDEATSALDPKTTRQILELIRDINQKLNITVVIITHQMSVVKEVCSHVAILDDGCVAESGMVGTVFAAPKSEAGRRLVFPGGADAQVYNPQDEKLVRLVFKDSKTTSIPLIARLAAEEGVFCNVISASTQKLSETVYGSMMLGIPSAQYDKAVAFIHNVANVQVEEVDHHVQ